jgi:DNA-binding NtrC family response regulator
MLTNLTGQSEAARCVDDEALNAAAFDIRVLLTGEHGVGKQTVARLIHQRSRRAGRPFVTLDCASVSEDAFESAWVSVSARAQGGTLLLRGIDDLGARMQASLYRFLEGADRSPVAATSQLRLLAASRSQLFEGVKARRFRQDLFYRLNTIHIPIPPLRERPEDVPVLLHQFVREIADAQNCARPHITPEALQALMAYSWPENVRELRQVAEQLVNRRAGGRGNERMLSRQVLFEAIRSKFPFRLLRSDPRRSSAPRARMVRSRLPQ